MGLSQGLNPLCRYNLKCRHEVLGDVYYSDSLAYVDPNAPSSPSPATSPAPATPREASGGGGSSGVSGGTLIGVAVGCAMVGLIVALVVLFVYFKNRPPPPPAPQAQGTEHQFYNNPLAMDQARGLQPSEVATMDIRLPQKESPWCVRVPWHQQAPQGWRSRLVHTFFALCACMLVRWQGEKVCSGCVRTQVPTLWARLCSQPVDECWSWWGIT